VSFDSLDIALFGIGLAVWPLTAWMVRRLWALL